MNIKKEMDWLPFLWIIISIIIFIGLYFKMIPENIGDGQMHPYALKLIRQLEGS